MFKITDNEGTQIGVAQGKSIDKTQPDLGIRSIFLDRVLLMLPERPALAHEFMGVVRGLRDLSLHDPDMGITLEGCVVAAFDKAFRAEDSNYVIIEGLTFYYSRKSHGRA